MLREVLDELIIFIKALFLAVSVFMALKIIFGLAEWALSLWN